MKREINAIKVRWLSERELNVELGASCLTPEVRRKISRLPGPGNASVSQGANAVHFLWDPRSTGLLANPDELVQETRDWIASLRMESKDGTQHGEVAPRKFTVPLIYGDAASITHDLDRLASLNHCTAEEIIRRHLATRYFVAFCGFQPGFAYLEPMPGCPPIVAPRHQNPRPKVPAGAVALGGPYCGIYPSDGPGGWNLIGKTQTSFRDPDTGEDLWAPGDLVEFV